MSSSASTAQRAARPTRLAPLATVLGRRERGLLTAGLAGLAVLVALTVLPAARVIATHDVRPAGRPRGFGR